MQSIDVLQFKRGCLQRRRGKLLKEIAICADEIKSIDPRLAVIRSGELEMDLDQATEANSER
ncbi:MAG: hypothetical protein LUQ47_01985 [Methanotrichaceae archaeon]|nr:hypothetical protein [Methanotrichaceae archaeon]